VGDRFNVITRNVIRDNGKYGILTNGGMDNVIADNLIVDNSRKALGRFVGVLLSQTSYFEVSGNLIGSSTAAATQKFGIDAATAADYSVIMNNDVRGNREGGIRVGGTTTVVLDNLGTVVALV